MGEVKVLKGKLTVRDRKTGNIVKEIEIPAGQVIKFWQEKEPNNWHRKEFDRNKDGLVHTQIIQDIQKIIRKISYIEGNNTLKSKCLAEITTVAPKPKTQQSHSISKYKQLLKDHFQKHQQSLSRFKDKKLLVYICIYLRKERYEQSDVDNFIKPIIDALKEYFGDDNKVEAIIAEKKQLFEEYHQEDLDFLESSLVAILDIKARKNLLTF